ncbi:MAG: tetratricopeptide repeat protein [Acidobacteriota bacterium]|nr:tetratricopeptide repeat protein [Acidobacteriota bacterium]MDQ5835328.1 tetratricopeptide repeat protein [Acidobacteriota bacterium]
MSQNRNISLALALALLLSAGALAPPSALGNRVLHDPAPAVNTATSPATTSAPDSDSDAADNPDQPKHKESGLARVLAAPFRALARLFGGGPKKSKAEAAKRSAPPAPSGDAAAQAGANVKQESADAKQQGEASKQSNTPTISNTPTNTASASGEVKTEASPASEPNASNAVNPEAKASNESANAAPPSAGALARDTVGGAQAAQQQQGARILRPSDSAADAQTPRMWIPVIEGIPQDPLTQGRALLEHGYVQESIAELTIAAAQVGPNPVEANNLLGLAYDRMGWHTLAAEAYNRALSVAPKDPNVLANLGYSLYLADDYEGALRRLKQAAKLSPGTPVINNGLAIVEARLQKYDAAFKHFAAASNEYDAHLKLASILEDQKRDRDAIRHYEAALRIQPGTSAVLERLVALYERNGQRDKADQARRALAQPRNPQKTTTGGGG